ncbi:sulfotransferase family 2 domain-containing protein [Rhodovulum sp. MB263]|uniref:sulfotransferase family 2 domain-containing protein n=1 Tax=Rhodovulum sp. (strain MB263) TaxID=308754 RepID=UPI0009B78856|nr:sulfotransferase family 2 domain-containing protein [Rhodovulum sp. MB263]ARC87499.1 hypothetical protein B5V46_02090 [Rhodovulum sp. MB263]
MSPIVFLHIPKTAGQGIHATLEALVGGPEHVSPVRVHTQCPDGSQLPPGYDLYSGHIDWTELGTLPPDRFAFTVLRDPRERIASFYFFLQKEARALSPEALAHPANTGKRAALELSADDYFFGGTPAWQNFVRDHYDNFYTSYLATRRMRGRQRLRKLTAAERLDLAAQGAAALQGIYEVNRLQRLEADLSARFGKPVELAGRIVNAGEHAPDERRWPKLLDRFEHDASAARLAEFVSLDERLMAELLSSRVS